MNHSSIQAIFFDFDGVILESVHIKTDAFIDLFADWPQHRDAIVRLHVENGGMSRFEKFRIISERILDIPYTPERETELLEKFSALVMKKILACPFVPGAESFLRAWAGHIPMFVISGTPTQEMRDIVTRRGLDFAFAGVFGSPEKKSFWLQKLIDEYNYTPERCRFIGDADSDIKAARAAGVPFIARVVPGEYDPFEGMTDFPKIEDLTRLDEALGLCSENK